MMEMKISDLGRIIKKFIKSFVKKILIWLLLLVFGLRKYIIFLDHHINFLDNLMLLERQLGLVFINLIY